LDKINQAKSPEFADSFLVFIDAFELGNSIRSFLGHFKNFSIRPSKVLFLVWELIRLFQPIMMVTVKQTWRYSAMELGI